MYKFYILKTSYWDNNYKVLETFKTKDIIKGMKKTAKKTQSYINNGTVNDYTSFSQGIMEYKNKFYRITGNKLDYDKSIKAV